jgi:hypothetical protein
MYGRGEKDPEGLAEVLATIVAARRDLEAVSNDPVVRNVRENLNRAITNLRAIVHGHDGPQPPGHIPGSTANE